MSSQMFQIHFKLDISKKKKKHKNTNNYLHPSQNYRLLQSSLLCKQHVLPSCSGQKTEFIINPPLFLIAHLQSSSKFSISSTFKTHPKPDHYFFSPSQPPQSHITVLSPFTGPMRKPFLTLPSDLSMEIRINTGYGLRARTMEPEHLGSRSDSITYYYNWPTYLTSLCLSFILCMID